MAKCGLNCNNVSSILRDIQTTSGWALCIGAGTSVPIFPSWGELVEALVSRKPGSSNVETLSQSLLNRFSPDALIQAAYNILSLSEDDFVNLLSAELYSTVKKTLSKRGWNIFEKAQLAEGPASIGYDDWSTRLISRGAWGHILICELGWVMLSSITA